MNNRKYIFLLLLFIIILVTILFSLKYYKEKENLMNSLSGILYYNDEFTGVDSFDLSSETKKKVELNSDYTILDYQSTDNGYYCIARDESEDYLKTYFINSVNDEMIQTLIPESSGKLGLIDNGVFFYSDYYTTSEFYTLCYLNSELNTVTEVIQNVTDYCIVNNEVFFIKNENLYQFYIESNAEELILENCCQIISSSKDVLFYKTDNGIYKYNISTQKTEKFSAKKKYDLVLALDNNIVIVSKINYNSGSEDEVAYNPFIKLKIKYYILSNDKLFHLNKLDKDDIEWLTYVND